MIRVKNLKRSYGDFHALKGISFEIQSGEIIGLLGPNGAGKTTTMKILTGLLNYDAGEVDIFDIPLHNNIQKTQREIGYLPEQAPLYNDLNVKEHLEFAAEVHGITGAAQEKAIKKVIQDCGLADRLYFEVTELSKGYKQRLGLAQALIHDPKILILDEPTTGLDPNQIVEIRDLIREIGKKKTIILSTHIMQEVEATCSRVIMLSKGEIVAEGTPEELMRGGQKSDYRIMVIVKGSKKQIQHALSAEFTDIHIEDAAHKGTYEVIVSSDKDARSEISKLIVNADLELLEIKVQAESLEEVFQDLTR